MGIDAAGILCREILEISRKSQHGRELVAGLRIEISVADAAVDRAMAETDIRQVAGAIQADRNVAGDIDHVIVDTGVPAIGEHWNEIGKPAVSCESATDLVMENGARSVLAVADAF